jgi:hypothetical protein
MNYTEEAARWGFPVTGILEDLRKLCERVRAAAEGKPPF